MTEVEDEMMIEGEAAETLKIGEVAETFTTIEEAEIFMEAETGTSRDIETRDKTHMEDPTVATRTDRDTKIKNW